MFYVRKNYLLFFLFVNFCSANIYAQTESEVNSAFKAGNYKFSLAQYQTFLKLDPTNLDYKMKIAICLINLREDYNKAIDLLNQIVKSEKPDIEAYYQLGKAYHLMNKFDDAISEYALYKEKTSDKYKAGVSHLIEMCQHGKELVQFPQDITFENLGKNVNSDGADYLLFVPANESFIMFSSKRKGTTGSNADKGDVNTSDIFISEVKNGNWSKAKNIGTSVNTLFNEDIAGISADGKTLFIYIDNAENSGVGDLFVSTVKGKLFQRPVMLNDNVNSVKHFETSAALSNDGNTLFFVSDKEGGFGGKDIYYSKKMPNGDWSVAINLGNKVNSAYDEDFPFLTADGKKLYFSSKGHNSMGGYDVFKSEWDEETASWQTPKNLGYPLNTSDDNMNFSVGNTERDGYISAFRPEGLGDLDIYKVTFNQIDPKYTVFKGYIQNSDSVNITEEAIITINSKKTKEVFGNYTVPPTKKGKYLFYLPPGKYEMDIEVPGYKPFHQDIIVNDKVAFKDEIISNLYVARPVEEKKTKTLTKKNTASTKKSN